MHRLVPFPLNLPFSTFHHNMADYSSSSSIHPCTPVDGYTIHDNNGTLLASATESLSIASVNQWLQHTPHATATLTLYDGDTIDLPVYALRRRNAVVESLPDAPQPACVSTQ